MNALSNALARSHVPAGEPSTTKDAAPLLNQHMQHLHDRICELESLSVSLERRLSKVLTPQSPQPAKDNQASPAREDTYVAEVESLVERVLSVYGRVDSILDRLHV